MLAAAAAHSGETSSAPAVNALSTESEASVGAGNDTVSVAPAASTPPAASFDSAADAKPSISAGPDTAETATLQKVEIIGRKQTSYKNDVSFTGTKTATRLKDVPQSVSYVSKELMQDQLAVRSQDIIKNMSGVNMFSGYESDFSIRGFRSFGLQLNGLKFNGNGWNQAAQWNLERYEVIKGPASALSGNANPGGTVNLVTKKPLSTPRQSLSFTTGSFDTYRTSLDFTGPLNDQKSLLYRLNIGYENAGSFRNLQLQKNLMVAPSVSFLPDDRTRVNVDFAYIDVNGKLDRGQPIFGASAGTDLNSVPISFAIAKPNDYLSEKTLYLNASINHQLTPWLSLNASYLKSKFNSETQEHRTSNSYSVDGAGKEIPTMMDIYESTSFGENVNDVATTYAVADFKFGPTSHQALLSYDYWQNVAPSGGAAEKYAGGYRNAANDGFIEEYDPAQKSRYLLDANGNPVRNVPSFDLLHPDYSYANLDGYLYETYAGDPSKSFSHGVYLQDQIEWGPVKALLGVREEYYVDLLNYQKTDEKWVEQFSFIPRFGLVYALNRDINLYGTYTQGFQPQSAGIQQDTARYGGPFDPLTSRMIEAGVKSEFFDRRVSATASIFQITQNNILQTANDPVNPNRLKQRGQERGRGVEADVQGRITPSLSVNATGYFGKTEITKDEDEDLIGQEKENAPDVMGGIWARYNFLHGSLRGVGAAAGANYVGERNTFDAALKLPSYTVCDAALYYSVNKVQLTLKVNNVFDAVHWTGGYSYNRLFPGAPRTILASAAYSL
jgi:iron complex outermembrane receptor protein